MHNCHGHKVHLSDPQTITENSENRITSVGHSHEIEKASQNTAGIVKVVDHTESTDPLEALSANQGRILAETLREVIHYNKDETINQSLDAALGYLSTRLTASYSTLALAQANAYKHAEASLIYVVNDAEVSNCGLYTIQGGELVKAPWDALSSALTSEPFEVLQRIMTLPADTTVEYQGKVYFSLATLGKAIADGQTEISEIIQTLANANGLLSRYILTDSGKTQEEVNTETRVNRAADLDYVNSALSTKASQANTYTKDEVNSALSLKAPQSNTYTKAEVDTTFAAYAGGRKAYTTLALAQADQVNLAANTAIEVTNDGANNGTYQWNGTTLTKSSYDPLTQSKEFTLDQVTPIVDQIGPLVVRNLPPESGYIWALVDPVTGRAPVRCAVDGTFEIDNFNPSDDSIGLAKLSSDVTGFLPQKLNPESGYVWALVDPVTGRSPVRIGVDGTFYAETIRLGKSSVSESNIDSNLSRQIIAQKEDVQQTYIDPWRATKTEIALKTQGAGYWNQLPAFKTKAIFGSNRSGTSISIRKTANLPILGKYYAGEWSASNVASLRNVGSLTGPSVSNPSGTFTAGDYYYYANGSAVESTGAHAGMNVGDLLVYNGSIWVIQKAPGTVSSRGQNGYFWEVTADCTFDGVTYKAGDFILYVTRQTGGGGWQYERWCKINKDKGDLVYMGIVSALPASPLNNTVHEVGTAFDSYSVGDYLMYSNDAWMHIKNAVETVIANNESFYLTCTDASEYEVRRTDKSASSVGFSASSYIQSNVLKSTDELLLISDSMFGSGGVGAAILSESGRTGTVKTFGGSTSNQVMGMLEYFISQGDEFKGRTVIAWHGQNNQPSNAVNAALIRECSLKMQQLVGAIHSRIAFLSILGQRNLSWDSALNRYVANQHESQKANTGHLWELQDWYNKTFPNRHISPYQILIDAADDTPDPTFPGLTEKQVAQTYGIVPYSFFGGTMGEWGAVTNLRYLGNWSSSSLPTETANQFDYYLRTGGGSASEFLLVYINGQWVQKSMDITHLSNKGATALAKGVAKFLTENKM